jgi:hypothetical protein
MPRIVPVRASGVFRGDGWMGVKMRDASVVRGVGVLPIFAGLIGLLLLLGHLAARGTLIATHIGQWRESHSLPDLASADPPRLTSPAPAMLYYNIERPG